jgi:tetratricopeptide (TPR) repeat protein
MIRCLKCGFEVTGTPAFCPSCGTPMLKKIPDDEISKLVFRTFGKKYEEALEAAYTACLCDVENRSLHKNLILYRRMDLLSKESEYQDEAVKRFIEKNKNSPRLKEALSHYKLGLIYENGNKFSDATKEYDKAASALPDFAPAMLRRGMTYEVSRNLNQALRNYSEAGEVDPQYPLAFFSLGLGRKISKKLDEALESYKKCVALDPDCAAAHNNMGLIYVDKKDFETAEREFNEVLRIFPDHPTGLKNLELARSNKGRGLRRLL